MGRLGERSRGRKRLEKREKEDGVPIEELKMDTDMYIMDRIQSGRQRGV